jgi:putative cardiolipin synthase
MVMPYSLPLVILSLMMLLTSCATLPANNPTQTLTITDTEDTRLGKLSAEMTRDHPGESGFYLLKNGQDAFAARLILMAGAEKSIDAQYYMIHGDTTGTLFVEQLVGAADREVRVRLLIDDMDLDGRDKNLMILADHPNIDLRVFNPFSRKVGRLSQYITGFGKVTRRMHNKSLTIDNQVTIVGGRNIGDEYFGANPALVFGDLDVMAIGPVVQKVSTSFDQYWNNNMAYPIEVLQPDLFVSPDEGRKELAKRLADRSLLEYRQSLLNSDLVEIVKTGKIDYDWGHGTVLSDDPKKLASYENIEQYSLASQIGPFFDNLEKELLVFSPYFVPGKTGVKFLANLSRKGVRVGIITNSLASTDVGVVHAGYAKYRKDLLAAGIELYEVNSNLDKEAKKKLSAPSGSRASLHAKSFILDGQRVFIGSLNLDPRSITENTEVGIMLESEEVADDLTRVFNEVISTGTFRLELVTEEDGREFIVWHGLENGKPKTWNFDPYTSFFQRFTVGLLGLLPIESQL